MTHRGGIGRFQRTILWIAGALLLLFFSDIFSWVASYVIAPVSRVGTWIGASSPSPAIPRRELELRLVELEKQNQDLAARSVRVQALEQDYRVLQDTIGFVERQSYRAVYARVISRSFDVSHRTVLLDRGSDDGVMVGAPVVLSGGVLLGKISDVSSQRSVLRLLSDPTSRVGARLLSLSRTVGLVQGTSGAQLLMDYVPHELTVVGGDVVSTSGLEAGVPSGLLIGTVHTVIADPNKPFQQVYVEPFQDEEGLRMVSILQL